MRLLRAIFGRRRRRFVTSSSSAEDLAVMAESFVRAGGAIGLEEWNELEGEHQVALLKASELVWATRITKLALALRSPAGAAEVLAPFDGGLARQHLLALEELERADVAEEG